MIPSTSFEDFYAANFARICGAMYLATKNWHTAQEVSQEAFLKAYERWTRVSAGANPEAWVYKVAFNLSRRRWTRLIRREHFPENGLVSDLAAPMLSGSDAAIDLQRALMALPDKQRAVVVSRYMLGFSVEETGRVLHLSPANVRVLAYRACAALGLSSNLSEQGAGES